MFQSLLTEWAMARFHILGILTRLLWFSVIDLVLCLLAAGTGSTVHRVTWSIVGVAPYKNRTLVVAQGDTLIFHCENKSYSNIIYQPTREQFDCCNASKGSGAPVIVGRCFGVPIDYTQSVMNLSDPQALKELYFTSYYDGASNISTVAGGECLQGLKLAVEVLESPTVQPTPEGTPKTGIRDEGHGSGLRIAAVAGLSAAGGVIVCTCLVMLGCWLRSKVTSLSRRAHPQYSSDIMAIPLTDAAPPEDDNATNLSTLNRYYYFAGEEPPPDNAVLESPSHGSPIPSNDSEPAPYPAPADLTTAVSFLTETTPAEL